MKNQFTSRIVKFTFALMFILIASSCNEDNDAMDDAVLAQENIGSKEILSGKPAATNQVSAFTVVQSSNCTTECIEVGEESGATSTTGNYTSAKTATVSISNTATDVIFKFSGTEDIMQVKIDGNQIFCGGGAAMDKETYTYEIPIGVFGEDWNGCDNKSYSVVINRNNCTGTGSGNEVTIEASHMLVPVCPPSECIESFKYDPNIDGSYTFTYIPAEDMEDALVEFTFAQGVAVAGLNGFTQNGNGNASVWSTTSSFEACKTYTYEVTLTPDCSGNSGNSNVWTDFKVNNATKKGNLDNITMSCN